MHTLHEVLKVDTNNNKILVHNYINKTQFWESYDELRITTGGKAFCPDIKNRNVDGIFGIQTLNSGKKVAAFLAEHAPKNAVIIGGGNIGLEMAEAIIIKGLKVIIVNRDAEIMSTLVPDMGEIQLRAR